MTSLLFFVVSSTQALASIGLQAPTEVRCYDVSTKKEIGAGAFLDPQEAIAVVQLAEHYERGCQEKSVALIERHEEEKTANAVEAAAGGAVSGAALTALAFLKRKRHLPKTPAV